MKGGALAAILATALAVAAGASDVNLSLVAGIVSLTSEGSLQAVKLEGANQLDGEIPLCGSLRAVRIEPRGSGPLFAADLAGNDTLEPVEWQKRWSDGSYVAYAIFVLRCGSATSAYQLQVVWNPATPSSLVYVRDTYREGTAALGERALRIAIVDEDSDGAYDDLSETVLFADIDGDGQLWGTEDSHERFRLDEPFALGGRSYVVSDASADGAWITIIDSPAEALPKPPLLPGYFAPEFTASDLDGNLVSLFELRGSIVLLDFWAAWCIPCVAELPTVQRVHDEYADRGVVVIGVSRDRSESACREAVSLHALRAAQVFDGPDGPVADLYRISGIPMTYLIDRDGTIRARGLRGDALLAEVEALAGPAPDGGDE